MQKYMLIYKKQSSITCYFFKMIFYNLKNYRRFEKFGPEGMP
jgi:hypothetical protein